MASNIYGIACVGVLTGGFERGPLRSAGCMDVIANVMLVEPALHRLDETYMIRG
jgi:hypothetical protein